MNETVLLQLIISIGVVIAGFFTAYKYSLNQSTKREEFLIEAFQKMQDKEREYYATKNGHLERISEMFSKTIDKNTRALDKLSARIKDEQKNKKN